MYLFNYNIKNLKVYLNDTINVDLVELKIRDLSIYY